MQIRDPNLIDSLHPPFPLFTAFFSWQEEGDKDPDLQQDSVVPEGYPRVGGPSQPDLLAPPPRTDVTDATEEEDEEAAEDGGVDGADDEAEENIDEGEGEVEEGELRAEELISKQLVDPGEEDEDDGIQDDDGGPSIEDD